MPHKLHDIWKALDGWKVQAPHGILTFKTKRQATRWVAIITGKEKLTDETEPELYRYR